MKHLADVLMLVVHIGGIDDLRSRYGMFVTSFVGDRPLSETSNKLDPKCRGRMEVFLRSNRFKRKDGGCASDRRLREHALKILSVR